MTETVEQRQKQRELGWENRGRWKETAQRRVHTTERGRACVIEGEVARGRGRDKGGDRKERREGKCQWHIVHQRQLVFIYCYKLSTMYHAS